MMIYFAIWVYQFDHLNLFLFLFIVGDAPLNIIYLHLWLFFQSLRSSVVRDFNFLELRYISKRSFWVGNEHVNPPLM